MKGEMLTVENEQQTGSFKHNHLVSFMFKGNISLYRKHIVSSDTRQTIQRKGTYLRGVKPLVLVFQPVHGHVKLIEIFVTQQLVIHKVELATSMGKRVAVALSWEIHPSV